MAKASSLAIAALVMAPTVASAQPDSTGFGERDSFVLSVERAFGFISQRLGEEDFDYTIESKGFFTPLWGEVGFFSASEGITWGALLGFTQLHLDGDEDNDDSDLFVLRAKPRVGFTFSKDEKLAAWLRLGPSLFLMHSSGDGDDDDSTNYAFAASGEAYVVYTPVEHIGILAGPVVDVHLFGRDEDDDSISYSSFGLAAGMFGEF
jgi:hypothetical protein